MARRGIGYLAAGIINQAVNEGIITVAEVENDPGFKELVDLCVNGGNCQPHGYYAALKSIFWGITTKKVDEKEVRKKLNNLLLLRRKRRREKRRREKGG